MFIGYLHAKGPFKLKFFDECGLELPFHGKRLYGHAPVGERCIELLRYHDSPNIEYMNTVQSACDTIHFLQFLVKQDMQPTWKQEDQRLKSETYW